jgi:hypothetical protein
MAKCAKVLTTMQDLNVLDTIINSYGIKYFLSKAENMQLKANVRKYCQ